MKTNTNQAWVSERDLMNDPSLISEISSERSDVNIQSLLEDDAVSGVQANRRDFLKMLGFGISAATLASCEMPIKKAIPYTVASDEIVPGLPIIMHQHL
ncbi:MAG: hypothetical protein U0T81_01375 [Saprospiraceae bacterium]